VEAAAPGLGVATVRVSVGAAAEFEPAFQRVVAERAEALIITSSPFFASEKRRLVELAARFALRTVYEHRDFVEAGGLISYGADLREVFRRAAAKVDQVLKGVSPGEIPIEQPAKIELVINLRTAEALGVALPPALLARADAVIE
jgi:putative ABC transport system substrate-binding protein